MAIPVDDFVKNVRGYIGRSYDEIDCAKLLHLASGGAIRRGSNSQWRYEIGEHGRISDGRPSDPYPAGNDRTSRQLEIGMAVFMHKNQDTAKYPDGLGDYCHVGVVTSVNPLRITNASSERWQVCDYTRIGTFCAWAYLKQVDYGHNEAQEEEVVDMLIYAYKLQVTADPSLLIREKADTSSAKMGRFVKGATIYATEKTANGWYKLANGAGYVCGKFVRVLEQVNDLDGTVIPGENRDDDQTPANGYVTRAEFEALVARVARMEEGYDAAE